MEIIERRWCARWLDVQICDWMDGTLPATPVCTSRRPSMEHMQAIILYHLPAYPRKFPYLAPSIFIPNLRAPAEPYHESLPSSWADTTNIHSHG